MSNSIEQQIDAALAEIEVATDPFDVERLVHRFQETINEALAADDSQTNRQRLLAFVDVANRIATRQLDRALEDLAASDRRTQAAVREAFRSLAAFRWHERDTEAAASPTNEERS